MNKNLFLALIGILIGFGCQTSQEEKAIQLSELSISEIHEAYLSGNYTAEQLTKAYLERIDSLDEHINSISVINVEALNQAKALDQELKNTGKLRPLHGIPLIVKDNINTRGLPTTAGSLALKDFIPEEDAPIITKLVDAGAIILAKSNMAEWAFSPMHSESSTFGTTRNPYNLDHVPAGSSGGTGAAVAANFGTVGLGTDTGNSIRGPSSHNALVGFRTTLGLISRAGIVPLYLRNDVVGPMCRTVEDATRVMEVMVGIDPKDPLTEYSKGKTEVDYQQFLVKKGLENARIGVLRELAEDMDSEISGLFEKAILDLESLGAEVIDPVVIPNFSELRQNQWCATFKTDVEAFLSEYVKNDSIQALEDIIRVGSNSQFAMDRLEMMAGNSGRWGLEAEDCGNAYEDPRRIAFREAIESVMDSLQLDAIVYPSWNYPAARIEHFQEEYRGDNSQIISPHTGQPAFTVPMGFTNNNLPAGLQFLGRMYSEPTLIRLTYAYEQSTMHRKPPKISEPRKE
ncbi:amidase [Algoriphagus sp. NF]|jgi:Asp-tRNA(Asn)/Glu-tRNA(Gln) amidotransferase A subunit family amidase|uniref:amidase n=1 Tax=Algoriphagus sp. NF TaxID=2992756 RepID=UPI001065911A|nr:amidase [Algoriphagus sp. NF]MDE0561516.1 amidase [Algoriphagus sp. NF]